MERKVGYWVRKQDLASAQRILLATFSLKQLRFAVGEGGYTWVEVAF